MSDLLLTLYHDTENISEKNYLLFAAKAYDNPHCIDMEEFYSDLATIVCLKKLFSRYHTGKVLKSRLILNHLISFYNVFEYHAATKMLFFKIDKKYHPYLKTFLVYLSRCPDFLLIEGQFINIRDIPIDRDLEKALEEKC